LDLDQIGWVDFNLVFLPAAREEGYVVSKNEGIRFSFSKEVEARSMNTLTDERRRVVEGMNE
jgi:hypothetical protein